MENKNTRIQKAFEEINRERRKVLIAYITAGYPSLQSLGPIVKALEDGGANMVQIGIPFLDPVGDAPVVQILSKRAIENGFTVEKFFQTLSKLREETTLPLILRAYYTTIFGYGEDRFVQACKEASVDAVVVPDLPLEESGILKSKLDAIGVPLVPIVVPAPQERIKAIVASGGGFVYLMMGPAENETAFVTNLPLCLGIELRDPILAKKLTKDADNIDSILVGDVLMEAVQQACETNEFCHLTGELARIVEDFSTSLVLRT